MIASVLPTYSRAPLTFVSGQGSWLTESDGRRFLDLGAGIGVNALGHAHPALVAALSEQHRRFGLNPKGAYQVTTNDCRLAEIAVKEDI